jgi:TPR repeat protein
MRKLIQAAIVAIMLMPVAGVAQDDDAGMRAYITGDYETALKEWRPLADQGEAKAQFLLGWMYYKGQGVPQDYTEAVKWYRLAAEQGNALAQNNLGLMYGFGFGVPQDYVTAHMWFNVAAANGVEKAVSGRDSFAAMMTQTDVSEAQRRAKVCMASDYQDCD